MHYQTTFNVAIPFAGTDNSLLILRPGTSSVSQRFTEAGFPAGHDNLTASSLSETERRRIITEFFEEGDLRIETVTAGDPSSANNGFETALFFAAKAIKG